MNQELLEPADKNAFTLTEGDVLAGITEIQKAVTNCSSWQNDTDKLGEYARRNLPNLKEILQTLTSRSPEEVQKKSFEL